MLLAAGQLYSMCVAVTVMTEIFPANVCLCQFISAGCAHIAALYGLLTCTLPGGSHEVLHVEAADACTGCVSLAHAGTAELSAIRIKRA